MSENVQVDKFVELEAHVEKLGKDIEAFKLKYSQKSQKYFKKLFNLFWKNHPTIKAVVWVQYTPYFNDGEPCVFQVHDMQPLTSVGFKRWKDEGSRGWRAEEFIPFDWKDNICEGETISREEFESAQKFLRVIHKLPDDVFLDMFGDHTMVLATRKGFESNEHEHD